MILSNLDLHWLHPEGQLSTFIPTVTVMEPQLGKLTNPVHAAADSKHLRVTRAHGNCVCGRGPTSFVFFKSGSRTFSTSDLPFWMLQIPCWCDEHIFNKSTEKKKLSNLQVDLAIVFIPNSKRGISISEVKDVVKEKCSVNQI